MGRRCFNAGPEMTGSSDSGVNLRHNRHQIIVHLRQVTDLEPNRRFLIPGLAGRIVWWWCGSVGAAYFRIWKCPYKGAVTSAPLRKRWLPRQRAAINRIRHIIERDRRQLAENAQNRRSKLSFRHNDEVNPFAGYKWRQALWLDKL
jgi:hypothetical protein